MIIKIENYLLKQSENSLEKFDLFEVRVKQQGDNIGEKYDSSIAYGVTLERAVKILSYKELLEEEKIVELKEFLSEYTRIKDSFIEKLEKILN